MVGNAPFSAELRDRITRCGVIAVLVIDDVDHAVPLAKALLDGGVDVMELTLRTSAAMEAITRIRRQTPEMVVGVGTILTPWQVRQVVEAGVAFGVAPGANRCVMEQALASGLPFAPGIATPSDLEMAVEAGCRILKFFPAEPCGGTGYLKALLAPYAHLGLEYIPFGGLTTDNMGAYLEIPSVLAIGGSWLAPREIIHRADWVSITRSARTVREFIVQQRGEKAKCSVS